MAFKVGDRVVYPHHGAAVIKKKETRTVNDEKVDYFVLHMAHGDLTLSVPTWHPTLDGTLQLFRMQDGDPWELVASSATDIDRAVILLVARSRDKPALRQTPQEMRNCRLFQPHQISERARPKPVVMMERE